MSIVSILRRSRRQAAVASVAVLALTLTACGSDDSSSGGSEDKAAAAGITLVKPGKLTVCTHLPYKPFQYKDGTKVVGFDVDLLDLVAQDLGLEQEVVNIEWAQVTSGAAFQAKKCDMGMGAMTITPERSKQVHFSPYLTVGTFLMVKKGNPSHITTVASLSGKSAAVQASTTQLAALEAENKVLKKQGKPLITIKSYPADTSAAAAIQAGKVDAYLADATPVLYYIRKTGGKFETAGKQVGIAPEGVATRIGDPLGPQINNAIQALYLNGKIKTILAKWKAAQFALKNK